MQSMRQEALSQVEPDALDRVQLGRVGRQLHQGDVVRHLQGASDVPAGTVEHQHRVDVRRELPGEATQEHVHGVGADSGVMSPGIREMLAHHSGMMSPRIPI